jgi:hypothetical protein
MRRRIRRQSMGVRMGPYSTIEIYHLNVDRLGYGGMSLGQNVLTIRGPSLVLNRIHNTGLRLWYLKDLGDNFQLETQSEMYFGRYIYVLARTKNTMIISYKSPTPLTLYLETLLKKYMRCFFRNEFRSETSTEIWMAHMVKGQIVPLQTEIEEVFTDDE